MTSVESQGRDGRPAQRRAATLANRNRERAEVRDLAHDAWDVNSISVSAQRIIDRALLRVEPPVLPDLVERQIDELPAIVDLMLCARAMSFAAWFR
jgi:hypothetical protein